MIFAISLLVWTAMAVKKKLSAVENVYQPQNSVNNGGEAAVGADTTPASPHPIVVPLAEEKNIKTAGDVVVDFDFSRYKNTNATTTAGDYGRRVNLPSGIADVVQWIKPKPIENLGFFGTRADAKVDTEAIWNNPENYPEEIRVAMPYYLGGVFNYNNKPGAIVYAGLECVNCPMSSSLDYPYLTFVLYDGQVILTPKHVLSSWVMTDQNWAVENLESLGVDNSFVAADINFDFPGLSFPSDLYIADKGRFEAQAVYRPDNEPSAAVKLTPEHYVFSPFGLGDWYLGDQSNAVTAPFFYALGADHIVRAYRFVPNIVDENRLAQIYFDGQNTSSSNYFYVEPGSCRANEVINVLPSGVVDIDKDLVVVGYTALGNEKIYGLKDKNNDLLKKFYDNTFYPGKEGVNLTYDEFIARRPVVFWVDKFGRVTMFKLNDFQPTAECGKPVIYLYPPKITKVAVKLALSKLTASEPEYGNGWEVLAEPNGQLTELKSGVKYPYLFWEGLGAGEAEPIVAGFNVKKENVSKFLDEKLAAQGLNQKEIFDFKEFWLPKMQSAAYYFVTFYGTSDMNKIAPLAVSPKQDTVIRVLMDYRALSAPLNRPEQKLSALPRQGFTIIEWGGVLYR